MTFLFGNFHSRRILRVEQAGVAPAVYSLLGKMPGSPTARVAVLLLL
jgi:hypothetical protein